MVTDEQKDALIKSACRARQHAYAPYSKYAVGAALLSEDGRIYTGVNVENASFSLTICAERAALFAAVGAGVRRFLAIAVCTENQGAPCGSCRQVLREFAGDLPVLICDGRGNSRETSLLALLPDCFGPENLPAE